MTDQDLMALYGLKYNPFLPGLPVHDLWRPPGLDSFLFRIRTLLRNGGFGLVTGESGLGKSKALHIIADWLNEYDDLAVAVMQRPQSTTGDFYRELGDAYGVDLSPANRYGGFKALRARFRQHIKTTLMRPVLLIDEAQEACTTTLTELRLMCSAEFDSVQLITVILCGDDRLPDRFRNRELTPLGGRIRARYVLRQFEQADLAAFLDHVLDRAAGSHLMSQSLRETLVGHAGGNLRILTTMAAELLAHGAENKLKTLDDDAFFDVFGGSVPRKKR
jgi:type II secretory pathway predicted ATPase ExeA